MKRTELNEVEEFVRNELYKAVVVLEVFHYCCPLDSEGELDLDSLDRDDLLLILLHHKDFREFKYNGKGYIVDRDILEEVKKIVAQKLEIESKGGENV